MARIAFKAENKVEDLSNFPKLKLDENEIVRILCFEDPEFAFAHRLVAPKIVNGVVQYRTVKSQKGEEYEQLEKEFKSSPLCLGDDGVLQDKGVDPKNCPACKMAVETDMVEPPKRRFAMHVIQYNTNGKKTPVSPFGVGVKVWGFTDVMFNKLTDIVDEYGDLRKVDLILGPCTNKQYQKYEIMVSPKAVWLESDNNKEIVKTAIKEQKAKDLLTFCGRKVERKWLEDDLDWVRTRNRQAAGLENETASDGLAAAEAATLTVGLESLLDDSAPAKAEKVEVIAEAKVEKEEPKAAESTDPEDWDSLLDSLGS